MPRFGSVIVPQVLPFEFEDLLFEDVRSLPVEEARRAIRVGGTNLVKLIRLERPGVALCNTTQRLRREFKEEWREERKIDSRPERYRELEGEFDVDLRSRMNDSDCDPTLAQVTFRVKDRGENIGAFFVYNGEHRAIDSPHIFATAYPAPGYDPEDNVAFVSRMSRTLRVFLETDIQVDLVDEGGRPQVIVLETWKFPTDDQGHRWKAGNLDGMVTDLSTTYPTVLNDGQIREIQRKPATMKKGRTQ